jgi:hypothetical protein
VKNRKERTEELRGEERVCRDSEYDPSDEIRTAGSEQEEGEATASTSNQTTAKTRHGWSRCIRLKRARDIGLRGLMTSFPRISDISPIPWHKGEVNSQNSLTTKRDEKKKRAEDLNGEKRFRDGGDTKPTSEATG